MRLFSHGLVPFLRIAHTQRQNRVTSRNAVFDSAGLTRWLTALSLTVTFGILALGGSILYELRADAWHKSEQASDNLVLALSRDIAHNIALYDLSMQGAIKAYAEPALVTADPAIRQMAIFGAAATAKYLGVMLVTNKQGDVAANSLSDAPINYNLAGREHFLVHRQRPDVGLYISRVFEGRVANDKIIALSRRINSPDGSFDGIVSGAMKIAYFQDLFDKLEIGAKGSVTLFRSDGRVIMRRPYREADIDKDLGNTAAFRTYLTAPHGHLVGVSTLDGVPRLYTFHKINDLPLYLSIAIASDDIYAGWWHQAINISATLGALSIISVVLCLLFRREIKQRLLAETSLQKAAVNLKMMATTDSLTGIPNRRSYEDALGQEWHRAIRGETSVAILMLDVDCFKLFNDHYGHQQGDEVLKVVASCILANLRRPADTGARYGGEEFVALLPETDLPGALTVAETIRAAVAALALPHVQSPSGFVTISVGVAVARPALGDQPGPFMKQADDALYEAKRSGRDRVVGGTDTVSCNQFNNLFPAQP